MVSREQLAEDYPDLLFCDGLDEALVGVCHRFGQEPVALYDRRKVIEILLADGLSEEEAEEHFGFNIIGAFDGPHTPAFADLPTCHRRKPVTAEETLRRIDAFLGSVTPCDRSSPTT
jgi:hypothetical protein